MRDRRQPQNHPKKDCLLYRMIIAVLDVTRFHIVVVAIVSAWFGESMSNIVALQAAGMSGKAGIPVPIHLKR